MVSKNRRRITSPPEIKDGNGSIGVTTSSSSSTSAAASLNDEKSKPQLQQQQQHHNHLDGSSSSYNKKSNVVVNGLFSSSSSSSSVSTSRLHNRRGRGTLLLVLGLCVVIVLFLTLIHDTRLRYIPMEPPPSMMLHGRPKQKYVQVPLPYKRTFYIPEGTKYRRTITRAFRYHGFHPVDTAENAHFIYDDQTIDMDRYNNHLELKPWQRYNNAIPGTIQWIQSKGRFITNVLRYQKEHPGMAKLSFLPQTFRLSTETGRKAFQKRLFDQGGIHYPWVLKDSDLNHGRGVEWLLPPNSKELQQVLQRVEAESEETDYIIQEYVCKELTWWNNQKVTLRVYWAIASIDPLVVLYQDGYVRIGEDVITTTYHHHYHPNNETETHGLQQQTMLLDREEKTKERTVEELQQRIRQHYKNHRRRLKKRIKISPFQHVRNQIKDALAQIIEAATATSTTTFQRDGTSFTTTNNHNNVMKSDYQFENAYELYGADFVIDEDLDVWCMDAQIAPIGMEEDYDFRVELHRNLWRPLIMTVVEIQDKLLEQQQEQQQYPTPKTTTTILPLQNLGQWEIIYAGAASGSSSSRDDDQHHHHWAFQYKGYQRALGKPTCNVPSSKTAKNKL